MPTATGNMAYLDNVNIETCTTPVPQGASTQYDVSYTTVADLVVTGTNLTWYSDAGLTIEIPSTTPLVIGNTYYVTSTDNGCEGAALAVLFDPKAGVNELMLSQISIYPNPVSTTLTVGGVDKVDAVRVFDAAGKMVLNTKQTQFSIAHLKAGVYVVEIKVDTAIKREKIIVK